jgi:hypothetical protein
LGFFSDPVLGWLQVEDFNMGFYKENFAYISLDFLALASCGGNDL